MNVFMNKYKTFIQKKKGNSLLFLNFLIKKMRLKKVWILLLIPKNKFYHITHLIEDAKNKGKKVGVFPIGDDAWIDVGQWAEYQKAVDQL